jgi:hypothetical protein
MHVQLTKTHFMTALLRDNNLDLILAHGMEKEIQKGIALIEEFDAISRKSARISLTLVLKKLIFSVEYTGETGPIKPKYGKSSEI